MLDILHILTEEWAIRALIATSLVGITCGIIGSFIVLRNMSLIGDALSHAILPGIFVAFVLVGYSTIGFFVGSVMAGILTAVMITMIQSYVKTKNDAAIGIVFTFMFSIGVIGISWLNNQQGAHLDLKDFLFGNVLGISNEDIVITALVALYTVISVIIFYRYLFITTFQPTIAQTMGISVTMIHYFLMLLLSFAVVAALRAVGVILVVAMLITPASTALLMSERLKNVIILSAILGMIAAILGMIGSILLSTPPGPAMVIVSTAIYLLAAVFAPKKGILTKYINNKKQSEKIESEDILKYTLKHTQEQGVDPEEARAYLGIPKNRYTGLLKKLKHQGYLLNESRLSLSAKGNQLANDLTRAHRLWEYYQVDQMGMKEGQIHEEADKVEHFLSEEVLDELDEKLGHPKVDPHGSPIPTKSLKKALINQPFNKKISISLDQVNNDVESELWELGVLPKTPIYITAATKDAVIIKQQNKKIEIPAHLARIVKVEVA